MPGLYDLVNPPPGIPPDSKRLNHHLLDAAYYLVASGDISAAAAKSAIETELGRTFTTAENTDLDAIGAALLGQPDTVAKLVYHGQIASTSIAASAGAMSEATWRSILGIS